MANTSAAMRLLNQDYLFSLWDQYTPSYLTYTLLTLFLTLSIARFFSSFNSTPKPASKNGSQSPPAVPYWLPFLGRAPVLLWNSEHFLQTQRSNYKDGIFALNIFGKTHNIIYWPSLTIALLDQPENHADFEPIRTKVMCNVFGFPRRERKKWAAALKDLDATWRFLGEEPWLGEMVQATTARLRDRVTEFMTFATSPVDQMLWERTAGVEVKKDGEGEEVVEASLLPLVREFVAHIATPSITGSNFVANFSGLFEDLWTFDRGFMFLGMGLPRWFPVLRLTRAHIARKKLLDALYAFHDAMEKEACGQDPGQDWRDLDDVSPLIKARTEVYRMHNFSIQVRAACEVALLCAANAKSNMLVFWLINHVYSDPALLAKIREEIAPFATAVQPKQEFPIPEPARLENFDVDGLCDSCPLLKGCYVECLRVDTAPWSLRLVKQDILLQSSKKDSQGWLLKKGQYADVAHELHHTDPHYFDDPMLWKADRHLKLGAEEEPNSDLGSLRPYGVYALDLRSMA